MTPKKSSNPSYMTRVYIPTNPNVVRKNPNLLPILTLGIVSNGFLSIPSMLLFLPHHRD